ncbi:hypothetical protein D6764_02235 [Candidatus Woesearchaeota archaeon]|nr:MAG: hypothetical protein D6764_02235 [Candidatus Woesearchaeota archaeon]
MEKHKGKKIALQIFLSGLFALLVTYIGFWIYDIFTRTGSFVQNDTEDPTFQCVGYVFDVKDVAYSDDKGLSFLIVNKPYSDYPFSHITVVTDTGQLDDISIGRLHPGKSRVVHSNVTLNTTFKVFPEKCDIYGKLYSVS